MTGTIFLLRTGNQDVQEGRFAGACQDQHAGHPAPSLGWPGERKSIGATSRGKRRICGESQNYGAWGPPSLGPRAWGRGLQGLGARAARAWGRGLQGLGPRAHMLLVAHALAHSTLFRRSERQAKGWETAETAVAEVGAWREYPPYHPPRISRLREKRRGFSPSPLLKPSNTPPKVGG